MRILGCMVLAAMAVAPAHLARGENGSTTVQWSELDEAWQITKTQQRPMLLYITMEGCHFCNRMEHQTYSDPGVISAINQDFVATRVRRAQRPDLVQKLGVTTFPTTVVISHQREVLCVVTGYVPPDQLKTRLEAIKTQRLASNRK